MAIFVPTIYGAVQCSAFVNVGALANLATTLCASAFTCESGSLEARDDSVTANVNAAVSTLLGGGSALTCEGNCSCE